MWKDNNNKLEELYINFKKIKKFPTICPICKKDKSHIYMHIYDEKTRRGGLWIWCSECQTFLHGSIYVPDYWVNYPLIELEKLNAVPIYLEEMKDEIDRHTTKVANKEIFNFSIKKDV